MEGNGVPVIKIDTKGVKKFQIGDGKVFELDIIKAYNEWLTAQEPYIDEQRRITDVRSYTEVLIQFVTSKCGHDVDGAQAHAFLTVLINEQEALHDFFGQLRRARLSSPERSAESPASGSTPGQESFSGLASNRQPPGKYSTIQEVMPDV